jgi:hypothetical protein
MGYWKDVLIAEEELERRLCLECLDRLVTEPCIYCMGPAICKWCAENVVAIASICLECQEQSNASSRQ